MNNHINHVAITLIIFVNTEQTIGKWWWKLLEELMQAAGKAE